YIDSTGFEHSVQTGNLAAEYTEGTIFEYEQPQNDMNVSHKIKFALAVAAAFCNLLMTAHYFILKQKYKIAVKKLCGYTNKSMMFKYVRNISMITILAYTIGSGLAVLLTRVTLSFSESQFSVSSFVAALVIVVMTAVIVTCQLIANSSKVNISSVLKG
ncbi:MAG: ABC transporter permease, partial [Oscillospiraceae bacterium]|nr:ABC transporter permease [Oscillospiraceae bacterium]